MGRWGDEEDGFAKGKGKREGSFFSPLPFAPCPMPYLKQCQNVH
ncbi:hypothetical protein [Nostoc linckia]|nr:hypothetical protein [Nostoc linckia]